MTTKKSKDTPEISEEELLFFRNEVSDVRPLKSESRVEIHKKKPSPKIKRTQNSQNFSDLLGSDNLSDPVDLREAAVTDSLFFSRPGIQHKIQKKLKRGEFPIQDELDLHGYTVRDAKLAIQDFISECKRRHIRYIRIIHGKGYRSEENIPILKTHVAYWLPQHKDVMAFSSALPSDGGTGAIYVILKVVRE